MNIKKILSLIERTIFCPVCKRKFVQSEIKIKAIYNNIIIFSVECSNNHTPIKALHIIISPENDNNSAKKSFLNISNLAIIFKQIDNFNGDFKNIWKK